MKWTKRSNNTTNSSKKASNKKNIWIGASILIIGFAALTYGYTTKLPESVKNFEKNKYTFNITGDTDSHTNYVKIENSNKFLKTVTPVIIAEQAIDGQNVETYHLLAVDSPPMGMPFYDEAFAYTQKQVEDVTLDKRKAIPAKVDKKREHVYPIQTNKQESYLQLFTKLKADPSKDYKNLAVALVENGFGRYAESYVPKSLKNDPIVHELQVAEKDAKANKRGIWSIKGYVTKNGYNININK